MRIGAFPMIQEVQEVVAAQIPDLNKFADVAAQAFDYRSTIAILVLAGYGFVLGRRWPKGSPTPDLDLWNWILVLLGFGACGWALIMVGMSYQELGENILGHSLVPYYTPWSEALRKIDWLIAASAVLLAIVVGRPKR